MSLTDATLLNFSGTSSPTAYGTASAQGVKAYLGRIATWDFQVNVAGPTGAKVKFQTTQDDPDLTPRWADMVSEHLVLGQNLEFTLAAGDHVLRVRTGGTRAVRPLAIINGAPQAGDAVTIFSALPLAGA